jgi:hypothetical protein
MRPILALNQYGYPEQFFWVMVIRSPKFHLGNPNRERIPNVEPNGIKAIPYAEPKRGPTPPKFGIRPHPRATFFLFSCHTTNPGTKLPYFYMEVVQNCTGFSGARKSGR